MACVLLVEDEAAIILLLAEELADAGHEVREAISAPEAEALLASIDGRLDVLVTDINVGRRGWGFGFAQRAREVHADLAVVYITGDSEVDFAAKGVPGALVLPKPFTPKDLVATVARAVA
jgi:DNA-binding NtrC family response regulator